MKLKDSVIFVSGAVFLLASFITRGLTYQNETDGFRNIKWQTETAKLKGLKEYKLRGGAIEYTKENDNLNFEGMESSRILYSFVDNKLDSVILRFDTSDDNFLKELKAVLEVKFGRGISTDSGMALWQGNKTDIKLQPYGDGVEIIFSDNKTTDDRQNRIDEFNAKLRKEWDAFLEGFDAKTAAGKMNGWLTKEGREILDSFEINSTGQQIALVFKGGGLYMFAAYPERNAVQTEGKKIYSVQEAFNVINEEPARFKGKEIMLKAYRVDGTTAGGCEGYSIFTDFEYVNLYKRRHSKKLSLEEKDKISDIPIIKSGPVLSMPKDIFPTTYGIYRGHFFDNSINECKDGWMRFVITGKEQEITE